ncbi:hypothetical protein CBR_g23049 [Chara braunii]|uniref:Hexosyltransferase n=1 Tax=Chara braunii TaxID=69332 RepID=A0A388L3Q3_CHABU|nr:hypothetical protein CBR_g23049 [Chara braunii]|eukprot:GBG76833.1 hypothetical protein CBR_g23049 [Chara braunii]
MSPSLLRSRLNAKEHLSRFHGRGSKEDVSAAKRRIAMVCTGLMLGVAIIFVVRSSHIQALGLFNEEAGFPSDGPVRMHDGTSGGGVSSGVTSVEEYLRIADEIVEDEPKVGERRRVLGFVGIQTGFASYARREAIRKTWLYGSKQNVRKLEKSLGLVIRFVIGTTDDDYQEQQLQKEMDEFGGFLRVSIHDTYADLNQKTLAFFKEAYKHTDAEYYVKADDDIYLRLDRLAVLLVKERTNNRTYIGCMKKGPVITDRRYKWFEPDAFMLGREYFLHAWGPMYILSNQVVSSIVALPSGSLRMLANEDVTVGLWMLTMNVQYEDERRLCHSSCAPDSIAVWDMPTCAGLCNPAKSMPEIHRNETCSKSPNTALEKALSRLHRWKRFPI